MSSVANFDVDTESNEIKSTSIGFQDYKRLCVHFALLDTCIDLQNVGVTKNVHNVNEEISQTLVLGLEGGKYKSMLMI